MNRLASLFPWAVVAAFGLWAGAKMLPRTVTYRDFDLSAFGSIPVLDEGRVKPLDSVARTNLLFLSGRSEYEDPTDTTRPAVVWLMEVLASGDPAAAPAGDLKVFRIDNEQLLEELGLEYRPGSYRYSYREVVRVGDRLQKLIEAAQEKEAKKERGDKVPEEARDVFHGKVLELGRRLKAYERLATRETPTYVPSAPGSERWLTLKEVDDAAGAPHLTRARDQAAEELMAEFRARNLGPGDVPEAVVLRELDRRTKAIARRLGEADRAKVSPAAAAFAGLVDDYKGNRFAEFPAKVAAYKAEYVYPLAESLRDTTRFEQSFNSAYPFYYAAFLYIFAFVLGASGWLGWSEPLRKAGVNLALAALLLTVAGLLGRMYLMGRPLVFVTNLYSSALMIGAGAVGACLYLERLFRNGVALGVGTVIGALTVKIAHHLSTDGSDNLGMLVAVLDTNLWLASHVTTVTLGYAATYIAGFIGGVYILWGLILPTLTKELHLALGNMIYGVTCFATLLSFVGTVLGGIWADQSWGRFWGWDPKENGAVLIVIWNSLILHARWAGIVRQRGMAVLAVAGVMVTTWSWFGTNQLGVGLHNYGFNKSLADGCKWTWLGCLVVIALGCVPLRYWCSFFGTGQPRSGAAAPRPVAAEPAAPPPADPKPAPAANGTPPHRTQVKGKPRRRG